MGVFFGNDELGLERNLALRAAYNYQLTLNNGILAIGIGGGLMQKTLNGAGIRTPDGDYFDGSTINHNDNFLPTGQVAALAPTFEFGVYYKSEQLEIGLSTRDIVEQPIEFEDFIIRPIRSFFFTASGHFELNRALMLHPSVFCQDRCVTNTNGFFGIIDLQ
ncbi:MAG: type IX secretion system membrane protein PorP/SprF [Saprospiraceae bacterium]|nr:type IX secretion system membrane protein PorP/SprF [Saprospiraceae bacterium]